MISNKIARFSTSQLANLFGLPYSLLKQSGHKDIDSESVTAFCTYLLGDSSWELVIRRELENKNYLEAFQLLCEANGQGDKVESNVIKELDQTWHEIILSSEKKILHLKDEIKKLIEENTHFRDIIEDIKERLDDFNLSENRPTTTDEILNSFEKIESIDSFQKEVKEANELVEEYKAENIKEFINKSRLALNRFLSLIENGRLMEKTPESDLFELLPKIILSRDNDLLEKINDEELMLETIFNNIGQSYRQSLKQLSQSAPRIIRKVASSTLSPGNNRDFLKTKLSTFSEAVYNQAVAAKPSTGFTGIEKIRSGFFEGMNFQEKGNQLLGYAKFCDDVKVRYKLLGEGLMCHGFHQMLARRHDHARKLLVDALNCLVKSNIDDNDSIEETVYAILTSWIWPQVTGVAERVEIEEWLKSPKGMLQHLRKGKYLDVVGKIWANEISYNLAAERFIEIVSANLGDDRTLFRHCTEKLLSPYNMMRYIDRVFQRLKWLLRDAEPPPKLLHILNNLAEEINPGSDDVLSSTSSKELQSLTKKLIYELDQLPKESVAPIREISELLPALIDTITGKASKDQTHDPEINIRKLVNIMYPDECIIDCEFPIIVYNNNNSAPASDVTLVLRYDGPDKKWAPNITTEVVNVGEMMPGQQKEAIFIMDFPEGLSSVLTEWKFKIEIQTDNLVKGQGFSVKIRPSARAYRSSPYVTGTAVSGDGFIGRENEMRRIVSTLCGDNNNIAIAVYGTRRIGKTSILKQIGQLPDIRRRYYTTLWDVEDWSRSTTDFLMELSKKILSTLPTNIKKKIALERNEFRKDPFSSFENFLATLDDLNLPCRILVMIDEFDKLLHLANQAAQLQVTNESVLNFNESFSPEIFASLRKALMTRKCFSMIIAGLPVIMQQKYDERFFGLLEPIQINSFNKKEAEEILNASESVMRISKRAREMIFEASGLQPYILQLLCNELFHRMKYSARDTVASFDVKEVIEKKLLPNENYFVDYETLIGDERPVLYGLALGHRKADSSDRKFVSISVIQQELAKVGLEYDPNYIKETLESLTDDYASGFNDRPLVKRAKNNPRWFKLIIGLLGDHLIRQGIDNGV